ncbi:MAG: hypothetical protein ABSF45_15490 [Terriglobia bacterium]
MLKPARPDTASAENGRPVKVVKRDTTPAKWRCVLGPPSSRADLGDEALYRYQDLTVEFHGGRVTDIR